MRDLCKCDRNWSSLGWINCWIPIAWITEVIWAGNIEPILHSAVKYKYRHHEHIYLATQTIELWCFFTVQRQQRRRLYVSVQEPLLQTLLMCVHGTVSAVGLCWPGGQLFQFSFILFFWWNSGYSHALSVCVLFFYSRFFFCLQSMYIFFLLFIRRKNHTLPLKWPRKKWLIV